MMDSIVGMFYNSGHKGVAARLATLSKTEIDRMPSKTIPLTKGFVTIVDEGDYDWLMQWKWCFCNGYAIRGHGGRKNRDYIYMHRLIMNFPNSKEIDHINGNKLDNRRSNLRISTRLQNGSNIGKRNGVSKYKGVSWHKGDGKWVAQIHPNRIHIHLGCFDNEEDAAFAYNKAAKKHFGEFARLNEIPNE